MTEDEMIRKVLEMKEELDAKTENRQEAKQDRRKTRRQIEKEEKEKLLEEARNRNIGMIYKQLVKVFHPDLETDPKEKLRKEEIMKQLTVAYESNDLHTLLKIELEWIQKESGNSARLSDEKLSIYNTVLKEQVQELQMEMDMVYHHPRYTCLRRFADFPQQLKTIDLTREKKHQAKVNAALEEYEPELKSPRALGFLKALVKEFKQMNKRSRSDMEAMEDWLRAMEGF